jgi:cysteine-rich repeat protein
MRSLLVGICVLGLLVGCGGNPELTNNGGLGDSGADGGRDGTGPTDDGPGINVDVGDGTAGAHDMPAAVCGNGALEAGELCDDQNTDDDDGCSADCAAQDPEYDCSKPGEPCVDLVVCGDSQLEGDEACDDGNEADDDGCAADCSVVEAGFACPRPGKLCVALPECGNGERERGEACDDANAKDDDGCSATCQLETGFWCPPGMPCKPLKCGDGYRTPDEACDDGQDPPQNGDGCSATCQVEVGFHCGTGGCAAICGDGLIRGSEACDDAGRVSGDGCSGACTKEPFTQCSGEPSVCASTIACANSVVEPGEICDPPGVDGCLAGCKSFAPDVGPAAVCGNSVIEAGEQCDPPKVGKGCSLGCVVEPGFSCPRPGVCFALPSCGDGVLNAALGEECDDGDADPSDGCADCKVVPPYSCYGIQPSVCIQEVCGDGVRTPSEACDDGANGVGCTNCQLDAGWICPVEGQKCIERCGDGLKVGGEECDDHNIKNDDGCNAGCRIEPLFTCPIVGQPCVPAACGNNVVEAGEGCDKGDVIGGDGCGPTCQKEPTITPGPNPVVTSRAAATA